MNYFPTAPDVLTVDECANLLRVCTKQVRKMVKNKTLESFRLGNSIRILRVSVETYIENQLKAA